MKYITYEPNAVVIEAGEPAKRLIVVTGELDVTVEHGEYDVMEITMKQGDYLGEFAILGDQAWGASSTIGMQGSEVEAVASSKHFVVCLVLDADKFDRIIASHTIRLKHVIHSYKSLRQLHREEYKEQIMGVRASADMPLEMQQDEAKAFLTSSRRVLKWQKLSRRILDKHGINPTVAFADKLLQIANTKSFAAQRTQKEVLLEQAYSMVNPPAVEEEKERQERLLNNASFEISNLDLTLGTLEDVQGAVANAEGSLDPDSKSDEAELAFGASNAQNITNEQNGYVDGVVRSGVCPDVLTARCEVCTSV